MSCILEKTQCQRYFKLLTNWSGTTLWNYFYISLFLCSSPSCYSKFIFWNDVCDQICCHHDVKLWRWSSLILYSDICQKQWASCTSQEWVHLLRSQTPELSTCSSYLSSHCTQMIEKVTAVCIYMTLQLRHCCKQMIKMWTAHWICTLLEYFVMTCNAENYSLDLAPEWDM